MREFRIADIVLEDVVATVGSRPAESGGALLGSRDDVSVTRFIFDPDAVTGQSVYHNSDKLLKVIRAAEESGPERFLGILHSHPRSVTRPSGQDLSEFRWFLEENPDADCYISPIVTFDVRSPLDPHELVLGGARFSFYVSRWTRDGVVTEPSRPVVLPVGSAARGAGAASRPVHMAFRDRPAFAADIEASDSVIVLTTDLLRVPAWHVTATGTTAIAIDPESAIPATLAPAGETEPQPTPPDAVVTFDDLERRSRGLAPDRLRHRRVLLVGCGSVGSDLAEGLVRAGVGSIVLVDGDLVEAHNLGRSRFEVEDVGTPKVVALERRLRRISSALSVAGVNVLASTTDVAAVDRLVADADLVIAATDDPDAQALLNHVTRVRRIPFLAVGMYARAEGGEIVISTIDTPCWRCATAGVRSLPGGDRARSRDYGTGRLIAEPGLLADIQTVTSTAAKLAIGLLADPSEADSSASAQFVRKALDQRLSYVVFGLTPDYWFFPDVLAGAAGQFSHQTVWMSVKADEACPVCGTDPVDPRGHTMPELGLLRRTVQRLRGQS